MTSPEPASYPTALQLLVADAPFAPDADQLLLYGQFVGSWTIHSTHYHADGSQSAWDGEWHFAWVLGGRGIEDVILASGAPPHARGATLRCYDASRQVWHVCFMAPASGEYVQLVGRAVGERIVQEGAGPDPQVRVRWSFLDITPTTFTWRGEVSTDAGRSWVLEQEMAAVRRSMAN
jgi:hypothetical protein